MELLLKAGTMHFAVFARKVRFMSEVLFHSSMYLWTTDVFTGRNGADVGFLG